MLGKNAENLMKVVVESIKAAESACVKVCYILLVFFVTAVRLP